MGRSRTALCIAHLSIRRLASAWLHDPALVPSFDAAVWSRHSSLRVSSSVWIGHVGGQPRVLGRYLRVERCPSDVVHREKRNPSLASHRLAGGGGGDPVH